MIDLQTLILVTMSIHLKAPEGLIQTEISIVN